MTWTVEEGTERSAHWREENNDLTGGVLLWDGQPVADLPTFTSWTTPMDTRHHIVHIRFDNGWSVEIRLEEGEPLFPSDAPVSDEPRLTLGASNDRAINERRDLEEANAVESFVGDEWDFSYMKTGYSFAGAYVQWHLREPVGLGARSGNAGATHRVRRSVAERSLRSR